MRPLGISRLRKGFGTDNCSPRLKEQGCFPGEIQEKEASLIAPATRREEFGGSGEREQVGRGAWKIKAAIG